MNDSQTLEPARSDALIDVEALSQWLANMPAVHAGNPDAAKAAILARLKRAVADGRSKAELLLLADGKGTACARRLSDLQDILIRHIHDIAAARASAEAPKEKTQALAIIATGGYGRGTLAPGSDIDLLFLLPAKQAPRSRRTIEHILYTLWDLGFKVGHATRSVDECITLAREDITIRTAILEARHLHGDPALTEELLSRFTKEVVKGTAPEYVAAKLAERDERHRKQGESRYLVEPNVKEGKGGQRDLHTLFWIVKYVYGTTSRDELIAAGVFSREEFARFAKAEEFLWAIRCNLHFMTGRAEERLSFDHQKPMAERLGYADRPGMAEVERFMKHYFLIAKDVGDLTRIVCAALEEGHVKAAPTFNRLFSRRRRPTAVAGTKDFILDNDRLNIADPEVFARDPVNLIRIFHLAERDKVDLHPEATQRISRELKLIDADLRADPEANRLFLSVLTSRSRPDTLLRLMNETGVLGRFIPEFGRVVAMMEFSMYHHYTVDEHLIRTVAALAEIEHGEKGIEHPLAHELVPGFGDRTVLYVAALLHDIAKGRAEDHSIAGARVARRLGPRLGLTQDQTETVAWLIEHHLDMSNVAQQRDLNDHKTILDFAAIVQDLDRLKLLLNLTVADIRAVGPIVWNGWKAQLLRTLYFETEPHLTGGHSQVSRDRRVAFAKAELLEALADWPQEDRVAYVERHYPAYLLRVDLPHKLAHAALIRAADAAGKRLATDVTLIPSQAVTEITILAPDHPRLLSIIAGACAVAGANIVDAQIFTTVDGMAIDSVFVSRELGSDEDERRRAGRIGKLIEETLAGQARLPESVATRNRPRPRYRPFTVEPKVSIENGWSNKFTAIKVSGLDRPGLLYGLTRTLGDLNLNIGSAHITTYGERAVDVFYVTDLTGQQIADPNRQTRICRRLTQALTADSEPKPTPKPAARSATPSAATP